MRSTNHPQPHEDHRKLKSNTSKHSTLNYKRSSTSLAAHDLRVLRKRGHVGVEPATIGPVRSAHAPPEPGGSRGHSPCQWRQVDAFYRPALQVCGFDCVESESFDRAEGSLLIFCDDWVVLWMEVYVLFESIRRFFVLTVCMCHGLNRKVCFFQIWISRLDERCYESRRRGSVVIFYWFCF